jgi:hypothetical protein
MPNINFILNKTVVVRRRLSASSAPKDALNAPSYGSPAEWGIVYTALKCRIEVNMSAQIQFKPTGERLPPNARMMTNEDVTVLPEDRIYDGSDVWIVEGIQAYFNATGGIHHQEFTLLVE